MESHGGNPFFTAGLWKGDENDVPISVRHDALPQLAGMNPEAKRRVRLASVVPGGIEFSLVESAGVALVDSVSEAERRGFLALDSDRARLRPCI